eukprot:scaffold8641_cov134-Isochrysis_galbana.AAC.9
MVFLARARPLQRRTSPSADDLRTEATVETRRAFLPQDGDEDVDEATSRPAVRFGSWAFRYPCRGLPCRGRRRCRLLLSLHDRLGSDQRVGDPGGDALGQGSQHEGLRRRHFLLRSLPALKQRGFEQVEHGHGDGRVESQYRRDAETTPELRHTIGNKLRALSQQVCLQPGALHPDHQCLERQGDDESSHASDDPAQRVGRRSSGALCGRLSGLGHAAVLPVPSATGSAGRSSQSSWPPCRPERVSWPRLAGTGALPSEGIPASRWTHQPGRSDEGGVHPPPSRQVDVFASRSGWAVNMWCFLWEDQI